MEENPEIPKDRAVDVTVDSLNDEDDDDAIEEWCTTNGTPNSSCNSSQLLSASSHSTAFRGNGDVDTVNCAVDSPNLMSFYTPMTKTVVKVNNNTPSTPDLLSTSNNKADETIQLLRLQEVSLQEEIIKKDQKICQLEQKCHDFFNIIRSLTSAGDDLIQRLLHSEEERQVLLNKVNMLEKEKEQALEDVTGVENSFAELHRRYEKMKGALESSKKNEDKILDQYYELEQRFREKEDMYEVLKNKADTDAFNANTLVENQRKLNDREITVLKAQLKKAEMKINGLQSQIDQKNMENSELTEMVDELTKLKC